MFFFIILGLTTWLIKTKYGLRANIHPAFLIPFFMIIIVAIPLIYTLINSSMPYQNLGVEVISFLILIYQLGAISFLKEMPKTNLVDSFSNFFDIDKIVKIQKIIVLISLISLALSIKDILDYAGLSYSVNSMIKLPVISTIARYKGIRIVGNFAFYLGVTDYISLMISGILLSYNRNKFLVLLPIFIRLIKAAIVGARAGFMISIVLLLASYLIAKAQNSNNSYAIFTYKNIKYALLFPVLIVIFFLLVQMSRGGIMDMSRIPGLLAHLNKWFFAYLPSFNFWISTYDFDKINFGAYTFAGIFNILGLKERLLGLYAPINVGNFTSSNVFSAYRGLILDFHLFIIPIIYSMGVLSGWTYHKLLTTNKKFYFVLLICIYAFFLFSHTVSIFNYNMIVLSVFLFYIILKISEYKLYFSKPSNS